MRVLKSICLFAGVGLTSWGWSAIAMAQDQSQLGTQTKPNQQAQGNQQAQANQAQANQQANGGNNAQGGFYGGVSQSPWFSNPTIRQQLQLNDEQYNKLNNAYTQSYTRYNQGMTGLDKNLNESERAQRLQELNRGFSSDFSKATDGVFGGGDTARQRFNQLDWQYRGYGAFTDPSVQKQLNLTDEQLQSINKYNSEWNNQMGIWGREFGTNRERTATSFREARREAQNRINSTLTPDQRKMWNDMIGKPVEWPAEVYFTNPATSGVDANQGRRQ